MKRERELMLDRLVSVSLLGLSEDGIVKRKDRKKALKELLGESLKDPWCPLFGNFIPALIYELPSSSLINQCIGIIIECRKLWLIMGPYDGWHGEHSYPEPNEVLKEEPDYLSTCTKESLLVARRLFERADNILLNVQGFTTEDLYFLPSQCRSSLTDKVNVDRFMYLANYGMRYKRDIKPYEVFSIIALYQARKTLRLIIEDGLSKTSPNVMENYFIARSLSDRAMELYQQEMVGLREKEIQRVMPAAERFLNHQEARRKTIKKHNVKRGIKGWKQLEKILPKIVSKRKDKNNTEIAMAIKKIDYDKEYILPELNEYKNIWKVDTLRKIIAKKRKASSKK